MNAIKDLWNRSIWGKLALVVGALVLCNVVGSVLSGGSDEPVPVAEAPSEADGEGEGAADDNSASGDGAGEANAGASDASSADDGTALDDGGAAGEPAGASDPTDAPEPTDPPAPTEPPTDAPPALPSFGDGAYLVGVDIEPGRYRSEGGSLCYWARLSNFGGAGVDGILANDNVEGQAIVDIAATDRGFTSTRCGGWVRVE